MKETIDGTLDVIRSIANKLDGGSTQKFDVALLKNYIDLVFGDCRDDLSNPTYTKQAGLLLTTVIASNVRAFVLESRGAVECINQNLRQPKSPLHARDLLSLQNSLLKARAALIGSRQNIHPDDEERLESEPLDHLRSLFHQVYLPAWRDSSVGQPTGEQAGILKEAIRGLALLCSQQMVMPGGRTALLNSKAVCSEISTVFIHQILSSFTLSSNDNTALKGDIEDEIVLALRSIVMSYRDGFAALVDGSKVALKSRDWKSPSKQSLGALRDLMARLSFIGCSDLPSGDATSSDEICSPLDHFITLTGALLETTDSMLELGADPSAVAFVLSGIHGATRNFSDACPSRPTQAISVLKTDASVDWLGVFRQATEGARVSHDWSRLMESHYGFQTEPVGQESSTGAVPVLDKEPHILLEEFTCLSLFIVRHLHRRFTKETPASNGDGSILKIADELAAYHRRNVSPEPFLYQLAGMTSFVIRRLDVGSQRSCNLATEAFRFFRAPQLSSPYWSKEGDGILTILTMGILESLWPDAMVELVGYFVSFVANLLTSLQYKPDGIAQAVMCDTDLMTTRPGPVSQVRNSIVTILANKYKGGPSTADPERSTFKHVLEFWSLRVEEGFAASSFELSDSSLGPFNTRALSIMAGSIARQDRDTLGLLPLLNKAIGADLSDDKITARSMEILIQEKSFLTRDTHAVIRPLYRQWAYAHLVKPLYKLALPVGKEYPLAENYTVAILSILKHCPFTVYGDDVEPLVRLLITSLLKIHTPRDVRAALQILLEVLRNDSDAVKDHLRAIIGAVVKVHELTFGDPETPVVSSPDRPRAGGTAPAACRRLVLQLLAELPGRFEARHLLPYAPQMQRTLATASGDSFREVRKAALVARESWARVA